MLSSLLWELNIDLTDECLHHPFVLSLADGSLGMDDFRSYLAQDMFFLQAFSSALGVAAAKSTQHPDRVRTLQRLMGYYLKRQADHEAGVQALGIDLRRVRPLIATVAYTEFLMHAAWHEDVPQTLAAMLACMRLMNHISTSVAPEHGAHDSAYWQWVDVYHGREFCSAMTDLEKLTDDVAQDCTAVRVAYRYALQCVLDFFSAPLEIASR